MKKLLAIILFLPLGVWAQTKGSNTIQVNSTATFQEVGKQLIADGYQIADSNADFGTISTEWREIKFIKYRLVIAVLDGKIQLQSMAMNEGANAVLNNTGGNWLVKYKKNGVENDIWMRMEVFASQFGTDKTYLEK